MNLLVPEPAVPAVEPAPAPRATSEQKLASMNLDNRLAINKSKG